MSSIANPFNEPVDEAVRPLTEALRELHGALGGDPWAAGPGAADTAAHALVTASLASPRKAAVFLAHCCAFWDTGMFLSANLDAGARLACHMIGGVLLAAEFGDTGLTALAADRWDMAQERPADRTLALVAMITLALVSLGYTEDRITALLDERFFGDIVA